MEKHHAEKIKFDNFNSTEICRKVFKALDDVIKIFLNFILQDIGRTLNNEISLISNKDFNSSIGKKNS